MGATPPQFNPPRQQSSNKIWLWLLLALGVFCIVCAIGGFFMFRTVMDAGMGLVSCSMNGDLARDSVLAYALDHDGKLPNAATWQDDVRPYYERLYNKLMSDSDLKDVPDFFNLKVAAPGAVLECDLGGGKKSGFAYNSQIAGKNTSEFTSPTTTIVIWENDAPLYNANGDPATRSAIPPAIMGDKRDWIDCMIEGQKDPMESNDSGLNYESRPEDGLPPKNPGTTSGTPNPGGS